MSSIVDRLDRFFGRYYPDPIVFTIGLSIMTMAACLMVTDTTATDAIRLWGDGLPSLLTFVAQLSLTLIFSHTLANTSVVASGLNWMARRPGSTSSAYLFVAIITSGLSLVTWSLGLVGGAIIARSVAAEAAQKGLKLHYPLLVATAYAATCIWHMGYSSSAALFVATDGHALELQMGVIPVTQTVFTAWNGLIIVCSIFAICSTVLVLKSATRNVSTLDPEPDDQAPVYSEPTTPAEKLERSRWLTLLLAAAVAFYLCQQIWTGSFAIDLNTVNWSLLVACLLFVKSPRDLVDSMSQAGPIITPILLHYPFYAGMMSLMIGSGLVAILAEGLVGIASAETLPVLAFLSGGLLNIFIPSGGGQWVVQGPIFIEAANALGVPPEQIVMAVAYGDQWTNLIQPFWALPMLAIAGLEVRQILGFCSIFLLTLGMVLGGGLIIVAWL
ncbi:MAG: TIGR00366 family protein [Pseudomonadota bacterium]